MRSRREALKQARLLVAGTYGLLGPRAAERAIQQLLPFLDKLRRAGASWNQIADLLSDAGLRSRKGEVVKTDSLRAAASRAARRADVAREVTDAALEPTDNPHATENGDVAPPSAVASTPVSHSPSQTPTDGAESPILVSSGQAERLRARMSRAALMRGTASGAHD